MVNKLTLLQQDILRLLFIRNAEQLNQNRIAILLKVSQPAVKKALPKLEKLNLITKEKDKESKRWSITLNNTKQTKNLKRVDNLKQIYESGLIEYLEDNFPGSTIILFGSYSRGEDTIYSDIDIAVIENKDKLIKLEIFENILERQININFYKNWKEINTYLKNNILNGIVLAGGVEL